MDNGAPEFENIKTSVQDRPVEWGVRIGNVLSALILAAILWVGNTILELKDEIGTVAGTQQVNINRISTLEADNKSAHADFETRLREHDHRLSILERLLK